VLRHITDFYGFEHDPALIL